MTLSWNPLAHGKVGDLFLRVYTSIYKYIQVYINKQTNRAVDRVSAVQIHPLVVLWAVNGDAVFQPVAVVRLALDPVRVTERLTTWPAPGALLVHVVASKPPSRKAKGASVGNLDIFLNLGLLVSALWFSKVTLVVIAALHGIKPAHPIASYPSVRVASAVIKVLDEHVALASSFRSVPPPIIRIATKS